MDASLRALLEAKHAARQAAAKAAAKPKRKAKRKRKGKRKAKRKGKRRSKAKPSKLVAARRAHAQALRDLRAAQRAYNRAESRVNLTKGRLTAAQWNASRKARGQAQDAQL